MAKKMGKWTILGLVIIASSSILFSANRVCSNCSNGYQWCVIEGDCGDGHILASYYRACD